LPKIFHIQADCTYLAFYLQHKLKKALALWWRPEGSGGQTRCATKPGKVLALIMNQSKSNLLWSISC